MLLRVLNSPFDIDWCIPLHIALNMYLFPFSHGNLLVFRCKMSGHWIVCVYVYEEKRNIQNV